MSYGDLDLTVLLEGIRRGDAGAEARFARIYSDGIRFYLRRNRVTEDLDARVGQLLGAIVERVRRGWNPRSGNLAEFLREAVGTWQTGEAAGRPGGGPRNGGAEAGPAHARIQAKAKVLERALRGCGRRELEMLIRYYVNGQESEQALDSTGATEEEFSLLRRRLRRLVATEKGKQPPKFKTAASQ